MFRGIDVSHWQGDINWDSVKADGINFAIIKAGGSDDGFYTDSKFETNYNEAVKAGISVGAYYFVGKNFASAEDGVADANRFIDIIKGKNFDYPVYVDIEITNPEEESGVTDAAIAFCKTMEENGYFTGIYGSDVSTFDARLENERLGEFSKWVARYGSQPKYVTEYGMWQYTSEGSVAGIAGNVDMNYAYCDYPSIIKEAGLNGYSAAKTPEAPVPEPVAKTGYSIGTEVSFNSIFRSSTDTEPVKPLYTTGKITDIREGAPNPYLINEGMGWVNDSVIESSTDRFINKNIEAGNSVKFVGTRDVNGNILHVYYQDYTVLEAADDTVVLGHDGQVFARVYKTDVINLG